MDTNIIILLIQIITAIITVAYVILISKTIKSNKKLNQNSLFNEIIKQERYLKIKLLEYRNKINSLKNPNKKEEAMLDYDTMLFNYYEFLAICLSKNIVQEEKAKLFFLTPLKSVREMFEKSILFKKNFAKKEDYPGIQWLIKKWNI